MWFYDKPGQQISREIAESNCARSTASGLWSWSSASLCLPCSLTSGAMLLCCHICPDSWSLLPHNTDTSWPLWRILALLWWMHCQEHLIRWFVHSEGLTLKAWEMSSHLGWKWIPLKFTYHCYLKEQVVGPVFATVWLLRLTKKRRLVSDRPEFKHWLHYLVDVWPQTNYWLLELLSPLQQNWDIDTKSSR